MLKDCSTNDDCSITHTRLGG